MSLIQKLRRFLSNVSDVRRQAEINRLVTRAARRCVRDFSHALDDIPDEHPFKQDYRERVRMWKEVFWDCVNYRDQLHQEIMMLEMKVERLEKRLKEGGYDPENDIPF